MHACKRACMHAWVRARAFAHLYVVEADRCSASTCTPGLQCLCRQPASRLPVLRKSPAA